MLICQSVLVKKVIYSTGYLLVSRIYDEEATEGNLLESVADLIIADNVELAEDTLWNMADGLRHKYDATGRDTLMQFDSEFGKEMEDVSICSAEELSVTLKAIDLTKLPVNILEFMGILFETVNSLDRYLTKDAETLASFPGIPDNIVKVTEGVLGVQISSSVNAILHGLAEGKKELDMKKQKCNTLALLCFNLVCDYVRTNLSTVTPKCVDVEPNIENTKSLNKNKKDDKKN